LAGMHSALKPHGFRKKGATFVKDGDDVVLIVQLQKSRSSTATHVKATVNLSAYSRSLTRALGYPLEYPHDPRIHWQVRLGGVMPGGQDRWWEAREERGTSRAGEEIAQALTHYGLPALDGVSTTPKLVALWQAGRHPGIGAPPLAGLGRSSAGRSNRPACRARDAARTVPRVGCLLALPRLGLLHPGLWRHA